MPQPPAASSKTLGPDRVPENQKREVYERVRRALEAKGGVCTQHKVGSSAWDKHEQKVLEEGLRYYPNDKHSNMLIYVRIAASLPKKTVRDVAHHLRHMQDEHRAKMDAAAGMNPAKRHHPDPAAAAAMAAMHEHQMAAMFAANAAGTMAAMHTLPGMAPGMSGPGGPGPHLKDEKVEARVCALLQENMALINSIRENVVMGRFFDNHCLMLNFDKNIKEITALLATLPFADMQKLPVQINPYFITGSLPPGIDKRPPPQPQPQPHQHRPHHPLPPASGPVGGVAHVGAPVLTVPTVPTVPTVTPAPPAPPTASVLPASSAAPSAPATAAGAAPVVVPGGGGDGVEDALVHGNGVNVGRGNGGGSNSNEVGSNAPGSVAPRAAAPGPLDVSHASPPLNEAHWASSPPCFSPGNPVGSGPGGSDSAARIIDGKGMVSDAGGLPGVTQLVPTTAMVANPAETSTILSGVSALDATTEGAVGEEIVVSAKRTLSEANNVTQDEGRVEGEASTPAAPPAVMATSAVIAASVPSPAPSPAPSHLPAIKTEPKSVVDTSPGS